MLAKCSRAAADTTDRIISIISQAFWTVFYFFYFLVKGNPEWKCNRCSIEAVKNCCVEARRAEREEARESQRPFAQHASQKSVTKTEGPRGFPRKSFRSRFSEQTKAIVDTFIFYLKKIGRICYGMVCKIIRALIYVGHFLWAIVRALFWPNVQSKTLPPSAPKPFQVKAGEAQSFSKVEFKPEDSAKSSATEGVQVDSALQKTEEQGEESSQMHSTPGGRSHMYVTDTAVQQEMAPVAVPRKAQHISDASAHEADAAGPLTLPKRFTDSSLDTAQKDISPNTEGNQIHSSSLPSAPPPPPPQNKSIRVDSGYGREDMVTDRWESDSYQANETAVKKKPPGIGKLPAAVMAELHGTQKMRLEREESIQREMTQSCHPDMTQWKAQENESRYDRSATATPFRASSVGPTMKKLEQVVSRLDDLNDNEAQFVFRAKPSDSLMGKPVFSPMEEAERMRDAFNRSSRPTTPAHSVASGRMTPYGQESFVSQSRRSEDDSYRRRARTVGPIGRESMPRTSGFYAISPYTSHTARRTPVPFDRGVNFAYDRDNVTQGIVSNQVRLWPPASNARGAEVSKDDWVREVVREQDDGLITTMCRRVVERKNEDIWKWHDDHGHLLDEKKQRTWKEFYEETIGNHIHDKAHNIDSIRHFHGELDTVIRDGPGEARHWRRTVETLPTGNTRFQDITRQYNKDYVVESIVRNY